MTKLQMQIVINHHELRIRELEKNKDDMYEMLEMLVRGDSINDCSIEKEVIELLKKARGE